MRFVHTGDLHIGKRLHEKSLLEEQRQILNQILNILEREAVDALILAGDIYDKPAPGAEAVKLFDDFVYEVERRGIKLFVISGNHDSMERISFGSRIMDGKGIYFQENFDGRAKQVALKDAFGDIHVYLMPFIKPVYMNRDSYEDAFAAALSETVIDYGERNILIAHQFFTGAHVGDRAADLDKDSPALPVRAESETIHVGGLDNISYELVQDFDYVALGHLHRRQTVGMEHIRYAGSPLKYSFSEGNDIKSLELIDMEEKGNVSIRRIPLTMPRELRTIKGALETLISEEAVFAEGVNREDYICAVITDDERVSDAAGKLLRWYPNLLRIEYQTGRGEAQLSALSNMRGKTPMELFEEYYERMSQNKLTREQRKIVEDILGGGQCETD